MAFADQLWAQLAGSAFYNFGPDKPDPSLRSYPWFRTTDGRWYYFSGDWISPVNYDVNERRLYVGSLTDLQTYDGGDTGTPSDRSGPMWVEDTDFIGRSPMHPGAIPDSNPSKTLAVGENYGEGAHKQTLTEMVPHDHDLEWRANTSGTGSDNVTGTPQAPTTTTFQTESKGGTGSPPDNERANVVHPCRGCYLIKWSGRLYRRV